jgi:hypothetical protein
MKPKFHTNSALLLVWIWVVTLCSYERKPKFSECRRLRPARNQQNKATGWAQLAASLWTTGRIGSVYTTLARCIGRSRVKFPLSSCLKTLRIIEGGAIKNRFAPGAAGGGATPTPKVTTERGVYRRSGQTQLMRRNTPCCGRLPSPQDIRALFEAQISTCYFISIDRRGRP